MARARWRCDGELALPLGVKELARERAPPRLPQARLTGDASDVRPRCLQSDSRPWTAGSLKSSSATGPSTALVSLSWSIRTPLRTPSQRCSAPSECACPDPRYATEGIALTASPRRPRLVLPAIVGAGPPRNDLHLAHSVRLDRQPHHRRLPRRLSTLRARCRPALTRRARSRRGVLAPRGLLQVGLPYFFLLRSCSRRG